MSAFSQAGPARGRPGLSAVSVGPRHHQSGNPATSGRRTATAKARIYHSSRQVFTSEYKLAIVAEYDALDELGARGARRVALIID